MHLFIFYWSPATRAVYNVAKRSIRDQCKYVYIDDRLIDRPLIWKMSNGDIRYHKGAGLYKTDP